MLPELQPDSNASKEDKQAAQRSRSSLKGKDANKRNADQNKTIQAYFRKRIAKLDDSDLRDALAKAEKSAG